MGNHAMGTAAVFNLNIWCHTSQSQCQLRPVWSEVGGVLTVHCCEPRDLYNIVPPDAKSQLRWSWNRITNAPRQQQAMPLTLVLFFSFFYSSIFLHAILRLSFFAYLATQCINWLCKGPFCSGPAYQMSWRQLWQREREGERATHNFGKADSDCNE